MEFSELPPSFDSAAYYEDLRVMRDQALEASHMYGSRKMVAGVSLGHVVADWSLESGGWATLHERGIRLGATSLLRVLPTQLQITRLEEAAYHVTTFNMDLDDSGIVTVDRTTISKSFGRAMLQLLPDDARRLVNRISGDDEPTDSDYMLLYRELRRGASGQYSSAERSRQAQRNFEMLQRQFGADQ